MTPLDPLRVEQIRALGPFKNETHKIIWSLLAFHVTTILGIAICNKKLLQEDDAIPPDVNMVWARKPQRE
ncbi:hypothetical protein K7432_011870, partial [Basidiobolus ranarum]